MSISNLFEPNHYDIYAGQSLISNQITSSVTTTGISYNGVQFTTVTAIYSRSGPVVTLYLQGFVNVAAGAPGTFSFPLLAGYLPSRTSYARILVNNNSVNQTDGVIYFTDGSGNGTIFNGNNIAGNFSAGTNVGTTNAFVVSYISEL